MCFFFFFFFVCFFFFFFDERERERERDLGTSTSTSRAVRLTTVLGLTRRGPRPGHGRRARAGCQVDAHRGPRAQLLKLGQRLAQGIVITRNSRGRACPGQPIVAHASAARAHSPAVSSAYGSVPASGTSGVRPARQRQYANPVVYGEFLESENSEGVCRWRRSRRRCGLPARRPRRAPSRPAQSPGALAVAGRAPEPRPAVHGSGSPAPRAHQPEATSANGQGSATRSPRSARPSPARQAASRSLARQLSR